MAYKCTITHKYNYFKLVKLTKLKINLTDEMSHIITFWHQFHG